MKDTTDEYLHKYKYRAASVDDLEWIWKKDIAEHAGDNCWIEWKNEYIENNILGKCKTFIILYDGEPVGQGTLLFSPKCNAINGEMKLADASNITNINALRIEKAHEGKGHISKLVRFMEQYAKNSAYQSITIGVEATETRNLAIYLHWGYNKFVTSRMEDGVLVLYYSKMLKD